MSSYKRDFYFSEQHKKEIIRLCETNPKLSINLIENLCKDAKDEILAWRKKSGFVGNDRENGYEDQGKSQRNIFENKFNTVSSEDEDDEEIFPLFEPYVPRPPIGIQRFTRLTPKEIEEIRLNFIENVYFSTAFPIAYEDMVSLITHAGQPMCVEDLFALFGYAGFPQMIREMPEFYFLDVYWGNDDNLWFFNKYMPSKTKFVQMEEQPIPKKGVQITIAETAFKELDMQLFEGRRIFVTVLQQCLKEGRDENGLVSLATFQDQLSKTQKEPFKDAWKKLMPGVGQIKRVWNEVVYRDIIYDDTVENACTLKLKDKPLKLLWRMKKENDEAVKFWDKLLKELNEFAAAEEAEETKNNTSGEAWDDEDWDDGGTNGDINTGGNSTAVGDTVENAVETPKLENESFTDQAIEADDEFEEIKADDQWLDKDDSNAPEISPEDELSASDTKELSAQINPTEDASAKLKLLDRKSSRVIPDGSESEDEDYRVENCPARSETLLFNLVSNEDVKTKEDEDKKDESSNVENKSVEQANGDTDEMNNQLDNNIESEIDQKETNPSEDVLPVEDIVSEIGQTTVDKVVADEKINEMKVAVEEATVNTTVEADKESVKDTKKSAQKSSSDIPASKSRFKKKPVFSARKLSKKVPDGSESDEEDVRMENINPTINTTQVLLNAESNSEVEETKPKIAIPKIPSTAKKIFEHR
uniref:Uncharacterized protein n=1 Tax=Panagrolaimus sp. PS1159 TaxID=55785 RepID=A0AC35EXI2_9BILA